jgi:hypothetical protein
MINRRTFTKLAGIGPVAGLLGWLPQFSAARPGAGSPAAVKRWYWSKWKGMETANEYANADDPVSISKFFGDDLIRHAALAKCDYMIARAKHGEGYTYFNTQFGEKHKNLGSRDFLQECCEAGKKYNVLVLASYQIQYDNYVYERHPEWRMKDWQGKDIPGRLCFNARGYLDLVKAHATEMMAYDIVGFHFDMLDYGFGPPYGCFCESCQAAFPERFKTPLPRPEKPTWDESWDQLLEFRCSSNERFAIELREHVHARRHELSVDYNYHGYPPFNWQVGQTPVRHNVISDYSTAESLPWAFGYNMPSLLSLFLIGGNPSLKPNVTSSRFNRTYTDLTIRSVPEMKWEAYTVMSHGAFFSLVDFSNYDGSLDTETYRRIGEVFGETEKKQEYFGHPPVRGVGLYYSHRTRDWFARETPRRYLQAFVAAHKILVESHLPVAILFDETVSATLLKEYPVVYLPNVAILSAKEVAYLKEYVHEGGKLLATGHCGDFDWMGNPRKEFAVAELLGVKLRGGLQDPDGFVRFPAALKSSEGSFMTREIPLDCDLLTFGESLIVEPTTAKPYGELRAGTRFADGKGGKKPYFRPISPDRAVGPAVLVNCWGKGEVLYAPLPLDAAYVDDYGMKEHRLLVRNLLERLYAQPPFRIQAPLNVETMMTHDAARRRYIIHFVGFTAPRASMMAHERPRVLPPLMEEPLLYRARVDAAIPFENARALSPRTTLRRCGSALELTTEEIHEALVLEV